MHTWYAYVHTAARRSMRMEAIECNGVFNLDYASAYQVVEIGQCFGMTWAVKDHRMYWAYLPLYHDTITMAAASCPQRSSYQESGLYTRTFCNPSIILFMSCINDLIRHSWYTSSRCPIVRDQHNA
jgi:hypothetical protein